MPRRRRAQERGRYVLRKAAIATILTLVLSIGTASTALRDTAPTSPFGSSAQDTGVGYLPTATAFIYPVGDPYSAPTYDHGNANGYYISQMFNNSCSPSLGQGFYYGGQYFCGHTGVDLADDQEGGPVHAVANGVVVFAGYNSTFGEMVRLQHLMSDGSYMYSQYEHMQYGGITVYQGEVVALGQTIGAVGSTGFVTGAHLHFEIKSVNEDGVGYAYENTALLIGYDEPISFIANHLGQSPVVNTPTLVPWTDTPTQEPATPTAPPTDASSPATAASSTLPSASAVSATSFATPVIAITAPASATASSVVSDTSATATTATSPITATAARTQSQTASNGGEQQGELRAFYGLYKDYVTVTAVGLNVRSGSGYDYAPLNSVQQGARLGYLGMSGNGWVRVALPGNVVGYVARQWVAGGPLPSLPPVVADGATQVGTNGTVDVVLATLYPARSGPMMRDAPLEPLRLGQRLPYLGTRVSWDRVALPSGRIGWVLNWYLRRVGPAQNLGASDVSGGLTSVVTPPAHGAPSQPAAIPVPSGRLVGRVRRASHRAGPAARYVIHPHVVAAPASAPAPVPAPVSAPAPASVPVRRRALADVYVTVDHLNMRRSSRLAAAVIESLDRGTKVTLLGYHVSWVHVRTAQGAEGYVMATFVSAAAPGTSTSTPTPTPTSRDRQTVTRARPSQQQGATQDQQPGKTYVVVADDTGAHLRRTASLKAPVIVSVKQGTRLEVRGVSVGWTFVATDYGATGWVRQDLIASAS